MIRRLLVIMSAAYGAACAYGASSQTDFEAELLGRIRQHLQASVAGLPNYTCQETMERSIYAPTGRIEFRERLRLEVLVTQTGEMFAWPGSTDFTTKPLEDWIGAGAIGTGNFAVDLHNLFVASAATFEYAGIETREQQPVHRFNFHAPLLSSKRVLAVQGKSAITAYSGSFWVGKDSLDIVRLEIRAEEIPPDLACREEHESVNYGRVRLGVSERLLPSTAELAIVVRDGREARSAVAFSRCSHYTVQTSISFGTTVDQGPIPVRPSPPATLPAGIALVLRLDQPISIAESAVGDQILARLDKAVVSGTVSLPKGTRVFGRIRRLEQHFGSPASYLVGLQFYAAELSGGRIGFRAHLTGPRAIPDAVRTVSTNGLGVVIDHSSVGLDIEDDGKSTEAGTFRVHTKQLGLRRGFRTIWETQ